MKKKTIHGGKIDVLLNLILTKESGHERNLLDMLMELEAILMLLSVRLETRLVD